MTAEKLDGHVIFAKGTAHVFIGVFTPWAAALTQWVNSGTWPPDIVWWAIIAPASIIGGSSSLLAFLSGSFSGYLEQKKNGVEPK